MARKPRIHYPGAFYHVILRGNAGNDIFFDDHDRYRFYLLIQYVVEKFRCRIHGFCLMRNHVHLVVQVDEAPLSRVMQSVSQRFTSWINHTQSRTGHLFQGRYKAILIDADSYLLELIRYVHLNPVRAGAAATPEEYPWSGHGTYLGTEQIPWLASDFVLAQFSPEPQQSRKAYQLFVLDGIDEGKRNEFHCGTCEGRILGGDSFTDDIRLMVGQKNEREYALHEVVEKVCASFSISEQALKAPGKERPMTEARAVAAAVVQCSPHLRLTDLGKVLNRDLSALAKSAQRALAKQELAPVVGRIVDELRGGISICQA
jgi:REP element-mobilizing transposase RayT